MAFIDDTGLDGRFKVLGVASPGDHPPGQTPLFEGQSQGPAQEAQTGDDDPFETRRRAHRRNPALKRRKKSAFSAFSPILTRNQPFSIGRTTTPPESNQSYHRTPPGARTAGSEKSTKLARPGNAFKPKTAQPPRIWRIPSALTAMLRFTKA